MGYQLCKAQCTVTISSDETLTGISSAGDWGGPDAATCNNFHNLTPPINFDGDITVDYQNSNDDFAIDVNFNTINGGSFFTTSTGSNNSMTVPSGVTVNIDGDVGDPDNNNIGYVVDGTMNWNGTWNGKNSNGFTGSGGGTGGSFDFNQNPSCPDGDCPSFTGVESCEPSGGEFCTNDVVLPITLGSFSAENVFGSVNLNWTTLTEENFEYFSIERSANGYDFKEIAQVPGAGGDSEELRQYSYSDKNPISGTSYYRLRSNDFDGFMETFNAVTVFVDAGTAFTVYPNPASNYLNFDIVRNLETTPVVTLRDLAGKLKFKGHLETANQITLPVDVTNGIYILELIDADFASQQRIIIQR